MHKSICGKLMVFVSFLILIGCTTGTRSIEGNGTMDSKLFEIESFNQFVLNGLYDVNVIQDSLSTLTISTDENLFEYIKISEESGLLTITSTENIKPSSSVYVEASTAILEKIKLNGAGTVHVHNMNSELPLSIELNGAANMQGEIYVPTVVADISGSGKIRLEGKTGQLESTISGAGECDFKDLNSRIAELNIKGGGSMKVHATDTLKVNISGAGSVKYLGNPELIKKIKGAGSVSSLE